MNLILIKNGYPITFIKTEDREEYMKALEKAYMLGEYDDFIEIVAAAVDRSIDTYLYTIQ